MFRNDFELLNETYATKVNEFVGNIGVRGDNEPGAGLSPSNIKNVSLPKQSKKVLVTTPINKPGTQNPQKTTITPIQDLKKDTEDCEECGGTCGIEQEDTDSDTYMAKQLLYRIFKLSTMIYGLMVKGGCDQKIEAWVLDKISKSHDNLNSVFGYKDFEDFKKSIQNMGGLFEETELDLYSAISRGGDDLVVAIKNMLKKESNETKQQVFAEVIKLLDS